MKEHLEAEQPRPEASELVDAMARFSATMFVFLGKAVVSALPETGGELLKQAMFEFGRHRGAQIRARVEAAGLPLTLENMYRFYDLPTRHAWKSYRSCEGDVAVTTVDYCPMAVAWLELNEQAVGALYCEVDRGIAFGYNPDLSFSRPLSLLEGAECCRFEYRQPPGGGEHRRDG
jgi:hypothetical protein